MSRLGSGDGRQAGCQTRDAVGQLRKRRVEAARVADWHRVGDGPVHRGGLGKFLMRQVAAIKPRVIVALGAVAAKTLLAVNESMANLRGRWYEFRPTGVSLNDPDWTGAKLAVTYHPAFLLRDPRQKKEAWKDLQMVMKELGIPLLAKAVE